MKQIAISAFIIFVLALSCFAQINYSKSIGGWKIGATYKMANADIFLDTTRPNMDTSYWWTRGFVEGNGSIRIKFKKSNPGVDSSSSIRLVKYFNTPIYAPPQMGFCEHSVYCGPDTPYPYVTFLFTRIIAIGVSGTEYPCVDEWLSAFGSDSIIYPGWLPDVPTPNDFNYIPEQIKGIIIQFRTNADSVDWGVDWLAGFPNPIDPYTFYLIDSMEGPEITTGIENDKSEKLKNFSLAQNYPNPFNPATTIRYSLETREFVTLKVYDILGKEVTNLFEGESPAGEHSVQFNGSNLASGVYVCRMNIGNGRYTETRKMILAK